MPTVLPIILKTFDSIKIIKKACLTRIDSARKKENE